MPKLSIDQVAALVLKHGWTGEDAVRMTAHIMAESDGDTNVVNSIGATGLAQILQPVHVRDHPTWTKEWLKNPDNNLSAARILWLERGWRPWAKTAASKELYMGDARNAVKKAGGDPAARGIGDPLVPSPTETLDIADIPGALRALVDAVNRASKWITTPANIGRIAMVAIGGVVIVGGILILARPAVEEAAKTVAKVKP